MAVTSVRAAARLPLALCLALALLAPGCGESGSDADAPSPLRVVATTTVVGDIVAAVGGEDITLTTLVGPNRDPRLHRPTAGDRRAVAEADLIIENGRGLEPFVDELASGSDATRVALSAGIALTDVPTTVPGIDVPSTNLSGETNAYVWQSPWAGRRMARAVQLALGERDPARADGYTVRAREFDRALGDAEEEIASLMADLPARDRILATPRDTFAYFARQFGFSTLPGDGYADPAAFTREVRARGVTVFFGESHDEEAVGRLADAGLGPGPVLYSDALGEPGSAAPDYPALLLTNARAIHGALAGS